MSIRGTLSLEDCVTDFMCEPVDLDDWIKEIDSSQQPKSFSQRVPDVKPASKTYLQPCCFHAFIATFMHSFLLLKQHLNIPCHSQESFHSGERHSLSDGQVHTGKISVQIQVTKRCQHYTLSQAAKLSTATCNLCPYQYDAMHERLSP